MKITNVHMFWEKGELTPLERISINSFLKHGYQINLWTYDEAPHFPNGVEIRAASEILPKERLFRYPNGSVAGFANLFRYAVLSKFGGLYSDTDVVCLTPEKEFRFGPFLVEERQVRPPKSRWAKFMGRDDISTNVNNNLIHLPHPKRGDLIHLALAVSDSFSNDDLVWGDTGPRLLTALNQIWPRLSLEIKPFVFSNAFAHQHCPHALLDPNVRLPEAAAFLHCYNQAWIARKVDKRLPFPKGSLMARFASEYL